MSPRKLFELAGQWIGSVKGSKQLYRFWYDSRNGEIRRRSLKTEDIEEAKKRLAEHVVSTPSRTPQDPEQVPLVFVLSHYLEGHADSRPSAYNARRACDLVLQFLETQCGFDSRVNTAQFSKLYQAEYAKWCATELKHSPAYVSRTLSVIAAACRYGSRTMLVKDEGGQLKEARLLRFMPEICYDAKWLAEVMQAPEPGPKDYVPTFDDLAGLLDCDGSQLLQRYDIIALNTWARPEAIVELNVKTQVDFEHGLLHLNPPNRRQNKKHRPTIRLTNNLRGWLEYWGENQPLSYSRVLHNGTKQRFASSHIKAQFTRRSTRWMLAQAGHSKAEIDDFLYCARRNKLHPIQEALAKAEVKGIQRVTRYTLRHFMATRVRGFTDLRVDREQRSLWLGHGRKDTTSWYETLDPEFLRECALATSCVIDKLNQLTHRTLVPPNIQAMQDLAISAIDGRIESTAAPPT